MRDSDTPPAARGPTALVATHRVQLRPEFGFDDAADLAGYLRALGASHMYCSPVLAAAPGSQHGYDVVDPRRANTDLGGEPAHARLTTALHRAGLGQLLAIVPNHMAVVPQNRQLTDPRVAMVAAAVVLTSPFVPPPSTEAPRAPSSRPRRARIRSCRARWPCC